MSPTSWPRRRHEDPLRLPSLSVPAEARRQDPAVQHDPAPRAVARGRGVLARAFGRGGRARRRASRRTAASSTSAQVDDRVQTAAHGRDAADAVHGVGVVLPQPAAGSARSAGCWREQTLRPDLRALLVGGALRASTCATCRRSSTSATWTRRSGSSTRSYKPFPLSLGYWWEGQRVLAAGEAPGAPVRPVHRDHARRVGDARELRHRRRRATGFPTVWTATTSRRSANRTTPTRSRSSGAWTTTPTSSACSSSAPTCCRCCARSGPRSSCDRRRRPVAGDAPARRARRRHGDRLGARRAALRVRVPR